MSTAGLFPSTSSDRKVVGSDRPRLARHVRLSFCPTRKRPILLLPETVVVLNGTGADILERCDGRHTVSEIVTALGARYRTVLDAEVQQFLTGLLARRCVELANQERTDGRTRDGRRASDD